MYGIGLSDAKDGHDVDAGMVRNDAGECRKHNRRHRHAMADCQAAWHDAIIRAQRVFDGRRMRHTICASNMRQHRLRDRHGISERKRGGDQDGQRQPIDGA